MKVVKQDIDKKKIEAMAMQRVMIEQEEKRNKVNVLSAIYWFEQEVTRQCLTDRNGI